MATKQEAMEWIRSLKPGDQVIHVEYGYLGQNPVGILTVSKVTPSGIIRANDGKLSFRQDKWTDTFCVSG